MLERLLACALPNAKPVDYIPKDGPPYKLPHPRPSSQAITHEKRHPETRAR